MQLQFASLLLASLASARAFSSSASPSPILTPSPAANSSIAVTPSPIRSSSAAATPTLNPDDYDCVYQNMGCDWTKSEYGYGADYCGSSPYEAGQRLSDGGVILAVSKDGSGDCVSKAGQQCCQVLAKKPCKYGEKYLECSKP